MIPKKLEDTKWQDTFFAIEDLVNKINEIIDCLQAKEEASKKDKYLCYTCNQWGVVGEHKCEASKGECNCLCRFNRKPTKEEYAVSSYYGCEHCKSNPPEHEDEWVKLEKDYIDSFGDLFHTWSSYGWWIKYIRDKFVAKEKIKREIEKYGDWAEDNGKNGYLIPTGVLKKSLGLGD